MKFKSRLPIKILSSLLLVTSISSCSKKEISADHDEAEKLFEKTLALVNSFTDSIRNASDSAQVRRLATVFEAKINNLNFEFPPDTDFNLTEEENDSIIKVIDLLVSEQSLRLRSFANKKNDTIPETGITSEPPFHNQHN